jgi:hypothetical protein
VHEAARCAQAAAGACSTTVLRDRMRVQDVVGEICQLRLCLVLRAWVLLELLLLWMCCLPYLFYCEGHGKVVRWRRPQFRC